MAVFDRQDEKSIRKWCKWQWNPITGCQHDCGYCPAVDKVRKLYSRTRNEGFSTFMPRLWPERFDAPHKTLIPEGNTSGNRNVMVGSLGDVFGDWVEREHIETLLNIVRDTPQWNYILLTKNPKRYLEFELPRNCWVGVKIDKQQEVQSAIEYFDRIDASVKFVSCDPMVVWLRFPTFDSFDWIIIGPKPKTKKRPAFNPPKIWVASLAKQAWASGCKVFAKHLKDPQYKSYPGDAKPTPGGPS
jgi:protein gp37